MNYNTTSLIVSPLRKSKLLAGSALMLALMYLIPACSDSGDPISPGGGGGGGGTNEPPMLNAIGKQYVAINNPLQVTISATDAESTPTFAITSGPSAATFTDNMDGTATFSWTPVLADAGIVNVTFTASDDSSATVNEIVAIEVITHTYDNYLGAIIQSTSTCANSSCHGAPTLSSGFDARTYIGFMAGGLSGPGIVPGNTANSIIYQRLLGNGGSQMPLTGAKFTAISGRMDSIATWILARAPEN